MISVSYFISLTQQGEYIMRVIAAFVLLAGIALIGNDSLMSQDKKDPAPKVKGTLPSGWGKLELTADQKSAIYKVQAKYKEELRKLKEKEDELKAEERREMVKLLTPEQKKKLVDADLGDTGKKDDVKKDATKDK
jgi:Spy/CpxP family protein refolding chaperone